MEATNRKSITESMKKFNPCCKKEDFIEVTEWNNGAGYDITIDEKIISLSFEELDAINVLIKCLEYILIVMTMSKVKRHGLNKREKRYLTSLNKNNESVMYVFNKLKYEQRTECGTSDTYIETREQMAQR